MTVPMTVLSTPTPAICSATLSKILATPDTAETWFGENGPEGAAFKYECLE